MAIRTMRKGKSDDCTAITGKCSRRRKPRGQRVVDLLAQARAIVAQYSDADADAYAEAVSFAASIDYSGKPAQVH